MVPSRLLPSLGLTVIVGLPAIPLLPLLLLLLPRSGAVRVRVAFVHVPRRGGGGGAGSVLPPRATGRPRLLPLQVLLLQVLLGRGVSFREFCLRRRAFRDALILRGGRALPGLSLIHI